jgi:hypothetical protein
LELNRLYYSTRFGSGYYRDGVDVFAEDWDNLISLDACRCDYYRAVTEFDGPIDCRASRGSASREFVRANFSNRTLHDVVYVSGNRWFLELRDQLDCEIHAHRDVERDFRVGRNGDDDRGEGDREGYVPYPETVLDAAVEALDEFPEKRLVVHLMQPHKPYLGSLADQFTYDGGLRGTMAASDLGDETLREAYTDTLEIALSAVGSVLEALPGRTVVTADHGELLGERLSPIPVKYYGHPEGIYTSELIDVPWHVVKAGPRRPTTPDPPEPIDDVDDEEVTKSLRALGYVR